MKRDEEAQVPNRPIPELRRRAQEACGDERLHDRLSHDWVCARCVRIEAALRRVVEECAEIADTQLNGFNDVADEIRRRFL